MSIWDSVSNVLSGGGRNDINKGTDRANQELEPYNRAGRLSTKQLQDMITHLQSQIPGNESAMAGQRAIMGNEQKTLQGYGNPADYDYRNAGRNPVDLYNERMNSYNESPEAKYAQEQALRASNAGASANGLAGSGAQLKELQENANRISQGDRQNYFNNVGTTDAARENYLSRFQNQSNLVNSNLLNHDTGQNTENKNRMNEILQYLSTLGYGAATGIGQNETARATANAKTDQSAFDSIAGLIGAGGQNYKMNSASNAQPGVSQVPWYMMAM